MNDFILRAEVVGTQSSDVTAQDQNKALNAGSWLDHRSVTDPLSILPSLNCQVEPFLDTSLQPGRITHGKATHYMLLIIPI